MGLHNFFDGLGYGLAFGMLSNSYCSMNPFYSGYTPYSCNFNFFNGPSNLLCDSTFLNPFPKVDFSEVCQTIWDMAEKRTSEYCKQLDEYNKKIEEYKKEYPQYNMNSFIPQYEMPFSTFYYPNQYLYGMYQYPWGFDVSVKKGSNENNQTKKSENKDNNKMYFNDQRFSTMLNIILKNEGGYADVANDKGGKTMKGVTTATYDAYRKSKGLSTQSVSKMTDEEMSEIYYDMFYKASGADKISDKKLALYVFDTAVNMGVSAAKKILDESGGSLRKFEQLRRDKYKRIANNDTSQKKFLKGWNNRVSTIKQEAETGLSAIA